MDSMLWELINTGKVIVYIDDILIFTKTIEEYHNIVNPILIILKRNKLTLQSKKCQFHKIKIDYLGIIISRDNIEVDPTKIKEVTEWYYDWYLMNVVWSRAEGNDDMISCAIESLSQCLM